MTERTLTRIFCSKAKGAHIVGRVVAATNGPVVVASTPVIGRDGVQARETRWERNPDAAEGTDLFCKVCDMRLFASLDIIVSNALKGKRKVFLTAEGMNKNPVAVLVNKGQRSS